MQENYVCTYPPKYKGIIAEWAFAVCEWLYKELSKIGGKLNDLDQRLKELE